MRSEKQGIILPWIDMIGSPRVSCASVSLATDVTDGGVSPDPCSTLLVVTLVMSSYLVALRLMLGLAQVASHWLGCELTTTEAGTLDGWHGLGWG
jgi:hypothetical protein